MKDFLRIKLSECGWREEMKMWMKESIDRKGPANLSVDWLMTEVTPHALQTVPPSVKSETLMRVRRFFQNLAAASAASSGVQQK